MALDQSGNEECDENTPLLTVGSSDETRTYKTRFWILGVFCLFSCLSCWQWNTWGPISESVAAAYPNWGSSRVALMANLGTIMFVVCVWPVCWAVEWLGLRVSMLVTCTLTTLALAMRCTTQDPDLFTSLSMVSATLLGVAMTMVMAVPPLVAMEWFPPAERATAQAVVFAAEQLGLLLSYLEPLMVRLPGPGVTVAALRDDITRLMYIGTGVCAALSLACFIYFPSRPAIHPSTVAAYDRQSLLRGVKTFIRKPTLLVVMGCYFACTGPAFGWLTVLDYSLLPLGVHQDEAMRVGGAAILGSAMAALLSGRYTDKNCGRLRLTLVVQLLLSSGCFYWFMLISEGTIPLTKWQLYVSVVGGVSLNFASIPVFYELAQELSFPCPEVVVGGMLAFADNVSATIFLLMYQLPHLGFRWVPYVLVLSCSIVVLPIFWIKVDYARSEMDMRGVNEEEEDPDQQTSDEEQDGSRGPLQC